MIALIWVGQDTKFLKKLKFHQIALLAQTNLKSISCITKKPKLLRFLH